MGMKIVEMKILEIGNSSGPCMVCFVVLENNYLFCVSHVLDLEAYSNWGHM